MSRFPFHFQHDAMQCGVACLQMVCSFYGKDYTSEELARLCSATIEGVSMLSISNAAEALGLHSVCGKLDVEKLSAIVLPAILHWNQNHFVVLYHIHHKCNRKIYCIADPGKGLVKYGEKDFLRCWSSISSEGENKGIVMVLTVTPSFAEHRSQLVREKRSFRFLFGYIRQYKKFFGQILLGLATGSLLQLIFPFLTQAIVDVGISHQNLDFIYLILLAQLMLTLSRTIVDFIRHWLLLHISVRINISLISDFFVKLLRLPMLFFETRQMGDLMQRMSDHNRIQDFLTTKALSILFSLISFVVFGCVLLAYNISVLLIYIFFSIIYGLWIVLFMRRRKVLDYRLFEILAQSQNKTYQFLKTMQEIKLQNCESRRRWEWEDVQAELFKIQLESLKLQQAQEAGCILINEIKNIVITVLSASAVIHGELTLGMMLAVQYIIGQLNAPIEQLMRFTYSLQDVRISLERINEVHCMADEDDGEQRMRSFPSQQRNIVFQNVSFRYDRNAQIKTIDNVNIDIEQGKMTAIVGTSGSGKTTLLKLLLGYYPIEKGKIIIAGSNISNYSLRWWRSCCGVVMQDGVIFSESIARNIAIDDSEVDVSRLYLAAKIAHIDTFIDSLPLKYNTIIGREGMGLSAGQRQRILIARAVYKDPQYIFLDEATNSLDANNEREIVNDLSDFYQGRTVIVIAHRLSTVRKADSIVVIENGQIAEKGTHDELTSRKGAYYYLVKNQLELGN